MKNSQYVPLKKRSISCRATCYHKETGNKFFAWGYGRSKKSAKAEPEIIGISSPGNS